MKTCQNFKKGVAHAYAIAYCCIHTLIHVNSNNKFLRETVIPKGKRFNRTSIQRSIVHLSQSCITFITTPHRIPLLQISQHRVAAMRCKTTRPCISPHNEPTTTGVEATTFGTQPSASANPKNIGINQILEKWKREVAATIRRRNYRRVVGKGLTQLGTRIIAC